MSEESSSEEADHAKSLEEAVESGSIESPTPEDPSADRQDAPIAAAAFHGPIPLPTF